MLHLLGSSQGADSVIDGVLSLPATAESKGQWMAHELVIAPFLKTNNHIAWLGAPARCHLHRG